MKSSIIPDYVHRQFKIKFKFYTLADRPSLYDMKITTLGPAYYEFGHNEQTFSQKRTIVMDINVKIA